MKTLTILLALCGVSWAETYRFVDGAPTQHDHRCASPKAIHRILDLVARSSITLGHDQATLTIGDTPLGADELFGAYSRYAVTDALTVIVRLDPIDCTRADCSQVHAEVSIIQRWEGATCYERWAGNAELAP